ncbi:IDEAL domain-containing protein [Macrococcus armenti]|uniref:IDEAL domain-containing protein n=1 Tax=Macrococcus armenti TaxID=2875764 RepID=A0ABY3ZT14_9STAP|nr:IDEAL domain-containing protein [Macrococcus armenti]UBH08133.1 IDEAL domain-containing protein [Macrococcus armenti]UBH10364.1 IDEAL domain-containing protein [Macrococcus armenti]UBH12663.1 IDEAL domain-containing protein [Macrococcus armenti]UBH14895.1 IDEAL domain-containing protein [Macrococcus armenti]UBH17255.1 IDEAL domain-containing protein [Macrococcus armenti]
MNNYQAQLNGLETFVSNLNNLYIELIIDDAIKAQKKRDLTALIDDALLQNDAQAFYQYTNELKQLEEL